MAGKIDYQVYLATDDYYLDKNDFFQTVEKCLASGVTVLQYRAKHKSSRQMLLEAAKLKELCDSFKVPLIINDRVDIALAVDADGLHIGQDDLPLAVARKLFPGKVIGVSATNYEEACQAVAEGADYIGLGPVFQTVTKLDAKPPCGVEVIRRLKAEFPSTCIVTIGGINLENMQQIVSARADGAAIISAILDSEQPIAAVRKFAECWNTYK